MAKMTRVFTLSIAALLLTACTAISSIPDDYAGPTAIIADSATSDGRTRALLFVLESIDGQAIRNAQHVTGAQSQGTGFAVNPGNTLRKVPIKELKLRLKGTQQMGAPIHEIAARAVGTFLSVEGEVLFTPKSGWVYVVNGELTSQRSCVWLEDSSTNAPVIEKICTK